MNLSDYARHISKKADLEGYSADRSRANDPLVKPYINFDRQKEKIKSLQESTIALCWVDPKGRLVPYDEGEFVRVQREIAALQAETDHNSDVLSNLEAKVMELGVEHFSLNMIRGEKEKLRERIEQIRTQPDEALAHKWQSVLDIGGNRAIYDALPEVKAARQKAAELIEPLEADIKVLDGQIESLESILRKIKY